MLQIRIYKPVAIEDKEKVAVVTKVQPEKVEPLQNNYYETVKELNLRDRSQIRKTIEDYRQKEKFRLKKGTQMIEKKLEKG